MDLFITLLILALIVAGSAFLRVVRKGNIGVVVRLGVPTRLAKPPFVLINPVKEEIIAIDVDPFLPSWESYTLSELHQRILAIKKNPDYDLIGTVVLKQSITGSLLGLLFSAGIMAWGAYFVFHLKNLFGLVLMAFPVLALIAILKRLGVEITMDPQGIRKKGHFDNWSYTWPQVTTWQLRPLSRGHGFEIHFQTMDGKFHRLESAFMHGRREFIRRWFQKYASPRS